MNSNCPRSPCHGKGQMGGVALSLTRDSASRFFSQPYLAFPKSQQKMADKKKRQTPTMVADKKKRRRPDPNSDDEIHHPFKSLLKPDPLILQTLEDLGSFNASSSSSSKTITLAVGSTCREVSDLDLPSIPLKIELQMLKVIKSILDGNGFAFEVPSRAAANQLYVPELDRIMLKDKTSLRRPQGHHHSSCSPADPPALPQEHPRHQA